MKINSSNIKCKRMSIFEMEQILLEYSGFRKLLDMKLYNEEYFGNSEILLKQERFQSGVLYPGDLHEIAVRMFDVRRFVLSLSSCNEKLFLFYHYIHGESTGRVAELMKLSRRSAFRLKRRALEYAAVRYPIFLQNANKDIKE